MCTGSNELGGSAVPGNVYSYIKVVAMFFIIRVSWVSVNQSHSKFTTRCNTYSAGRHLCYSSIMEPECEKNLLLINISLYLVSPGIDSVCSCMSIWFEMSMSLKRHFHPLNVSYDFISINVI